MFCLKEQLPLQKEFMVGQGRFLLLCDAFSEICPVTNLPFDCWAHSEKLELSGTVSHRLKNAQ